MRYGTTATPRASLIGAALLALTVSSCALDESPQVLILRGNTVVIRLPGAGSGVSGQCYANQAEYMRPNGTLDLMINNKYDFFPLIENHLLPTENVSGNKPTELRADSSMITVTGAWVNISFNTTNKDSILKGSAALRAKVLTAADDPTVKGWWVPFVVTIESRDEAYSRFSILPRDIGTLMREQWLKEQNPAKKYGTIETVTMHVTIEGVMQDGTIVRSQTMPYPIQVCFGCLVYLPTTSPGLGFEVDQQYQVCATKIVVTEYATPCVMGNDEYMPCTYYCYVCDQNKGDFQVGGFDCDPTFCPEPP